MPALIVATLQATIVLAIGIWAYQIPFAGSLLLFYFTMVIYGLSLVGFGLLISSLCATQQQAFIGVFVFMMPAILLSGYVSPVENMPQWLQDLTWINPIRHFTDITKQIYLKDASLEIVWGSLWPLLVIAAHRLSGVCDVPKERLRNTRHRSNYNGVGFPYSPQSHSYLCFWGFAALPPCCSPNALG